MKYNGRFHSLHFEITHKCNLRCKHCYNINYLESDCLDLSLPDVKRIIDIAIDAGCKDVGFSGGEPFMRNDMLDIIKYVKNYPIHILTNGLLLNENLIGELNKIEDLLLEFRISLDGLTSHNKLRNVSYENVIKNIKLLLDNEYVVTVNTMITDDNIDELDSMYEMFKSIGIDRWRLDFIFNSGNADKNKIQYLNHAKIFSILKQLICKYIQEKPSFEFDINKIFRSVLLTNVTAWKYDLETTPCGYQGGLTVRPNGDVSFCPSLCITHGNIIADGLDSICSQSNWLEISSIKVKDVDNKCSNCKYLAYCGGGCRADAFYDTGSLYGVSDFTCKLIEFYVCEILPLIDEYRSKQ